MVGTLRRWLASLGVAAIAIAAAGCQGQKQGPVPGTAVSTGTPVPGSSLLAPTFRFRFAIYTSQAPQPDAVREVDELIQAAGFERAPERVPPDTPRPTTAVYFAQPELEKFAPPDLQLLEHFAPGLSAPEKRTLAACRSVAVFEVVGASERALQEHPKALRMARAVAEKLGGFFWDDEARLAWTPGSMDALIDGWVDGLPDVSEHVMFHTYRDGELYRIVSLGMVKFALPDVVVNQVGGSYAAPMGGLAALATQRMVERGRADGPGVLHVAIDEFRHPGVKEVSNGALPGAKRSVDVTLLVSSPAKGDADNRLLELEFPGPANARQERQQGALTALFGAYDETVLVGDDEALLEASARARAKALALQPRFAEGPSSGEHLLVKAPFTTREGGTEWMWVEVVTWRGNNITGILGNDPDYVPELKAGARVNVSADEIFDYIHVRRDGTREGNETGRIIESRSR